MTSAWNYIHRLQRHAISSSLGVICLLLASELVYCKLVCFEAVSTAHSVVTFILMMAILFLFYWMAHTLVIKTRSSRRHVLLLIVSGAILFRLTLLFAGLPAHVTLKQAALRIQSDINGKAVTYDSYLLYDNDIWRYLWDGHVSAAGINPYLFAPGSHELDKLAVATDQSTAWSDIRANVNYPDVSTVYSPFALLLFRLAHATAPGSVLAVKSLLVICDLFTILFISLTLSILNRSTAGVLLYAWNPLVIKVVAGSGHVDAVVAMLLAGFVYFVIRGRHLAAAVMWGLASLVKFCPIVLLPFLIRRIGWQRSAIGILVIAIGYTPYLHPPIAPFAGLKTFASEWQFNSGFFTLIESVAPRFHIDGIVIARLLSAMIFLTLMIWLVRKDSGENRSIAYLAAVTLGSMMVLSPTVMPWYLLWVLPLAVVAESYAWVYFSGTVCLSFLVMIDGTERPWILALEFLPLLVMVWCACRSRHNLGGAGRVMPIEREHNHTPQGGRPWPA